MSASLYRTRLRGRSRFAPSRRTLTGLLLLLCGCATPLLAQAQNCPTGDNTDNQYILGEADNVASAMHWPTGLVWKRCIEGQTFGSGQCSGSYASRTWNGWATDYLPQPFASQTEWGIDAGYSQNLLESGGWRMAYKNELVKITEGCGNDPKVNRTVFPDTPFPGGVGSGSPDAASSAKAAIVRFDNGDFGYYVRGSYSRLRLVRGGQPFDALTAPAAQDAAPSNTSTFPAFTLSASLPAGQAWGGARIAGEGSPAFQLNGTGDWVQEAIVKSGDQITVRLTASSTVGASHTATFTLRSGQTTGTSADAANGGSEATALQQTSASFTVNAVPVAGVCGTADGVATVAAPSASLCSAGTASAVDGSAADAFTWSCLGQHGGADSGQCSAPRQYAVTPSAGANGTISPDTVQSVTYNQTTSFTVTPATGYSASVGGTCPAGSWSGSAWTTGAITAACTVEASFTQNTYAVTTSVSAGSGTVSCTPNPVPHGGNATCTATAATGFNFSSWGGACSGSGSCTLSNVIGSRSVTAQFVLETYAISTQAEPAAGGSVACDPSSVQHGGASTCTATANAGYRFTGWSGDCTGTEASCTLTDITADLSVTASFASRTELDLPLPEGAQSGQTLRLVATGGEWYFDEAHTRTHTGASVGEALPAGVTLPHGVVSLRLIGGTPGSSATVVLTYPEALPAGTRYYKYGPTAANPAAHWYEYPHAAINGNTITLTLTDGGAGDSDLSENGVIVAPGGPAQVAGDVAPDVTPIPTLSQWATLLLAGFMGLLAFGRLRRLPHA